MTTPTDRAETWPAPSDSGRDTRDRLIDAITAHGPVTARELAERFGLTSAAVRRHLAALEADGTIEEHEVVLTHRGRGRPSKSFVMSARARVRPGADVEAEGLTRLALDLLQQVGGIEGRARWPPSAWRRGRPSSPPGSPSARTRGGGSAPPSASRSSPHC